MAGSMRQRLEPINHWLVIMLAFCLPLSTTAVTIITVLLLGSWLVQGDFRDKWRQITGSPVCLALLGFTAVLLAGLVWSQHLRTGLEVVEQHSKLLLLPVFLTIVRRDNRWPYLWAFVAGVTVIMLSTYLAWFGLLQYADVTSEHLTKKTFHVVYNPMLALAIYLVMHQLIWGGLERRWRCGLALLAGLMIFNMFITEGRAGQLVFFVLMALLLTQVFRRNFWTAVGMIMVVLPLFCLGMYKSSPVFRERIDQAKAEISQYRANPNTSVGLRLLYWRNSARIIVSNPWLGVGTGDFFAAYARINHLFSRAMPFTDNPHNQYVYILVQLGGIGLVAMLAPFMAQILEARRAGGHWRRIRLALPLFFLVIMLTESYLIIYETGILFALLGAILFAPESVPEQRRIASKNRNSADGRKRSWLVLSYRVNVPGSACAQHIDDRLPVMERAGITPIILSGPIGQRLGHWRHLRVWSLAPSGIRFELRHYLRQRYPIRWQFKLAETLLLLPVFPLYLLEKLVINLESEWSWCFSASFCGILLQRRYRPEVIYSTGGSASAHLAALVVSKVAGVPWIAETQDPLVHDQDWQRSRVVYHLYRWLERRIAKACSAFVFVTVKALENARSRVGCDFPGVVISPGAARPPLDMVEYRKGGRFHFAHFGSLAGSRNLCVFLEALHLLLQEENGRPWSVQIDLYGSIDALSWAKAKQVELDTLIQYHGLVDRQAALMAMRQADCLLLIQNTTFFSTETIPSKVYEYLHSGRPILGLVHHNQELTALLAQRGHFTAPADDPLVVKQRLAALLAAWERTDFTTAFVVRQPVMLEKAVQDLVGLIPVHPATIPVTSGDDLSSDAIPLQTQFDRQSRQIEPVSRES